MTRDAILDALRKSHYPLTTADIIEMIWGETGSPIDKNKLSRVNEILSSEERWGTVARAGKNGPYTQWRAVQ